MESWTRLDRASPQEARTLLSSCCGATRWIDRMMLRRPFVSRDRLLTAAREEWFALSEADWRDAFTHHPKIGDRDSLRRRFAATAHLSENEQRGVSTASEDVLAALAEGNRAYETRFGYIFIVCATGRTAEEMLRLLDQRLNNTPQEEIRIAAAEQSKITELRLLGLS
jgi:2-oxo-4-hydroxy-4-carboxy-5-ureidoimidazoline decarboxylase